MTNTTPPPEGPTRVETPSLSEKAAPVARDGLVGAGGPPIEVRPVLTARDAARALAANGYPLDQARALVTGYLAQLTQLIGGPAELWGLDEVDLADLCAAPALDAALDPLARARAAVAALVGEPTSVPATAGDPPRARAAGADRPARTPAPVATADDDVEANHVQRHELDDARGPSR